MPEKNKRQWVVLIVAVAIAFCVFNLPPEAKPNIQIRAWDSSGREMQTEYLQATAVQTLSYLGTGTLAGTDTWLISCTSPPCQPAIISLAVEGDNTGNIDATYSLDVTSDWNESIGNNWQGITATASPGKTWTMTPFNITVNGMPELTPIYVEATGIAADITKTYYRELLLDYLDQQHTATTGMGATQKTCYWQTSNPSCNLPCDWDSGTCVDLSNCGWIYSENRVNIPHYASSATIHYQLGCTQCTGIARHAWNYQTSSWDLIGYGTGEIVKGNAYANLVHNQDGSTTIKWKQRTSGTGRPCDITGFTDYIYWT